jgi:transcriptional regulator with XRE-family HTH domain
MAYHKSPTALHSKIKALREHLLVKQKNLAAHMRISQRAYSKIENNETNLQVDHLDLIASFYQLEIGMFFVYSEEQLIIEAIKKNNNQQK